MKKANKAYWKRIFSFIYMYLGISAMSATGLTWAKIVIELSLWAVLPYLLFSVFTQKHATLYLYNIMYLFAAACLCLLGAITYTLLTPANAWHYYGMTSPWNYITLACCTLPLLWVFLHRLCSGIKSIDEMATTFIEKRKKMDLEKQEYYFNQKVNILRDITQKNIYDSKTEHFLRRHVVAVYRILWIASGVVPIAPIFLSRNFGQQPVDYYLLLLATYLAWACIYAFPLGLHITRTVMYIQKKHKVKLKLAYKDPKDVIIV